MIRLKLRSLVVAALAASVALATVAVPAGAAEEPEIIFHGGGWGHGIGMSQYGALGRALDGQNHNQILKHYYPGTTLAHVGSFGPLGNDDDIDVLIAIRDRVAVSTPWQSGAPQAGWTVEVRANTTVVGTATKPVTATYSNGRWVAATEVNGSLTDLCGGKSACAGAVLSMRVVAGTHVVLEETAGGDNLGYPYNGASGSYRGGRIALHPGALDRTGACGTAIQFCVIHADLGLEEYVKGIAEVPASWPIEAQKAQAVTARSYAAAAVISRARTNPSRPYDLHSSTADQVYAGYNKQSGAPTWVAAVDATATEVVEYNGAIAQTFYSSSNGGHSAEPPDVWAAGSRLPYLKALPDPFDGNSSNPNRARDWVYSVSQVSKWLNQYTDAVTGDLLHVGTIRSIEIDAPPSGRVSFADVVIRGTRKTAVLDRQGFLLYDAITSGCQATPGCESMRSTNFRVRSLTNFADVEYNAYYYLPVQWLTIEGLTKGVSPTLFGADQPNTRAQMATFVWRFAGQPAPSGRSGFSDIRSPSFYEKAVAWMEQEGITTGTSPTRFSPDGTVTRAEAATFLWRFAGSPASDAATNFRDVPNGQFYTEAVRWMVEWDITTGTTPTTFAPNEVLTRAQIATFLWRLAGTPDAFADGVELPDAMRK